MIYRSFVQSHFLKTIVTSGSIVFVSLLLINPDMYSGLVQWKMDVNAKFLSNEYETDMIVVNGSDDLKNTTTWPQEFVNPLMSYVVKKDDTLDMIARKYAVSVDQIKTVNNILNPDLQIWDKLYITTMPGFVYTVKEDSLSLMVFANLYNIDKEELLRVNGQANELTPYNRWEAIFVPNKTLEDAYYLSLLVRPQPLPQPQKVVVVSVPKKNSTSKWKPVTVAKKSGKPVTVKKKSSTATTSWRYVFSEKNGMAAGQCTYYAAHKAKFAFPEISPGVRFRGITGNANKWFSNAKANWFRTSVTPTIGAIAVFKQWWARYYSAGHVAIVEDVDRDNKRMKVSDMNFAGLWIVTTRWIDLNDKMTATTKWQTLIWFVPAQALPSALQKQYEAARK